MFHQVSLGGLQINVVSLLLLNSFAFIMLFNKNCKMLYILFHLDPSYVNNNKNKFSTLSSADWNTIKGKGHIEILFTHRYQVNPCSSSQSSSRREMCEKRTAMARNEYILSLSATNAHMTRYFYKELEDIMSVS